MPRHKHTDAFELFDEVSNLYRYKPKKDFEGYFNNMRKVVANHYKRVRRELYHFTPRSITRIYEIGEKILFIESEEFESAYYKYSKSQSKKQ